MVENVNKRFRIKYYSDEHEVGGLIIGKWLKWRRVRGGRKERVSVVENVWTCRKLLQIKSDATGDEYRFPDYPHIIGYVWKIWLAFRILPYTFTGNIILGTWHTHPKGVAKPSRLDEEITMKFLNTNGFLNNMERWIIGIAADYREVKGQKYINLQPVIYRRKQHCEKGGIQ